MRDKYADEKKRFLEVSLLNEPLFPSVDWLVGQLNGLVCRSVCLNFLTEREDILACT